MVHKKEGLFFLPIGGSNEIGMNCNLYGYVRESMSYWIMVDAGVSFVQNMPGCSICVPDIKHILKEYQINAFFLTHIHEDHIGAITYFYQDYLRDVPIYLTRFPYYVLKKRIKHSCDNLYSVTYDKVISQGPFSVRFFSVAHSTPESSGLYIQTDLGNIIHTGDWKRETGSSIYNSFNEKKLSVFAKEKVLAVVSDSTNIFHKGKSSSEEEVRNNLCDLIESITGRIFISLFASNIERIHSLYLISQKLDRKMCFLGKSIVRMYNNALDSGVIDKWDVLSVNKIDTDDDSVIFVCTGSQGEPGAVLNQLAEGLHPCVDLKKGDSVIFSSRVIPGNESRILYLQEKFIDAGIAIYDGHDYDIHVSGHPTKSDLSWLYNILKPKIVIPVHGYRLHTFHHALFAKSLGICYSEYVPNGSLVSLSENGIEKVRVYSLENNLIDGNKIVLHSEKHLSERVSIASHGLVYITIVLQNRKISNVNIFAAGLYDPKNDLHKKIKNIVYDFFPSRTCIKNYSLDAIQKHIRKFMKYKIGKTPDIKIDFIKLSI